MSKKPAAVFQNPASSPTGSPPKKGPPRGCLALFGLPFLAMGLFMMWTGGLRPLFTAMEMRIKWKETPCVVTASGMSGDKKDDTKPTVAYAYVYQEKHYTGNVTNRAMEHIATSRAYARAFVERHPAGKPDTCRVNPAAPEQSTLEYAVPRMVWAVIPFTGVFVAVGGGFLLFGLGVIGKKTSSPGIGGPLPDPPSGRRAGKRIALAFGIVFFSVGALVAFFFGVLPLWRCHVAGKWIPANCVILESSVGSHSGSKSTTYSTDLDYEYVFAGKTYRSDRYDFTSGSSSGYEDKAAIVARFPVGSRHTCLVNPDDPAEAVISRSPTWGMFGLIGFGAAFMGFGTFALVAGLVKTNAYGERETVVRATDGGLRLKPEYGPAGKLLFFAFFTAFWNGITSVFVTQAVKSFAPGRSREWGLSVFMIPFVVVGVVMIGVTIRAFFALFSPRLDLTLAEPARAGKTIRLRWSVRGDASKIREVSLSLEGFSRPESGSESGPKKFTAIPMKPIADILAGQGSAVLDLPADMTPSGEKTLWKIAVRTKIARGVNIATDHPVEILPAANPFA